LFEENFGELLRVMRRTAGLSQEDLAAASGSSVRTIRELERCRVTAPHRRTVQTMADALRLSGHPRDHFIELSQMNRFIGSDARSARTSDAAPKMRIPRQLPAAISGLVGRESQLSALARLTGVVHGGTGRTTSPVVIHGPPGIGKTSLAVAGGHQAGAGFPDGQLFADLRGTSADGPAPVADLLTQLLRSLAVPESAIPAPGTAREGLLRTLLWDRRVLIVLDDAFDEAQVRPLLPANARSMVLITCRRPLSGLDAAERIRLDVLAPGDARTMLAALAGPGRATADPAGLDDLIRLCGRWPLALRVAGNRLASNPAWETRHLLSRLRDRRLRLSALTAGDLDVRATLTGSYRQLTPRTAMVFRSAAAIPGADFDAGLVAAAAAVKAEDAAMACDELVDAGLLQCRDDRYHFNDLVRLFAAECVGEPAPDRAVRRLVDSHRPHRDRLYDPNGARHPAAARTAAVSRGRPPR
jgi:transcriptional regulator with XRE-family HTH domain